MKSAIRLIREWFLDFYKNDFPAERTSMSEVERINYQLLKDWKEMDTSRAAKLTDEQLLEMISLIHIVNGWGLVAELMKRYATVKGLV